MDSNNIPNWNMILGWLKGELPRIDLPLLFSSLLEKFLNQTNRVCGTTISPPIFFKRVELITRVWMQKEKEQSNFDIEHMFSNTGNKKTCRLKSPLFYIFITLDERQLDMM